MGKVALDADRIKRQLVDCAAVAHVLGLADGARRQSTGLTVCCPWHAERTPSCSVTIGPDRTLRAYCFGCDQGGDVFSLAAAALGLDVRADFGRVAQELAARCGLADSAPPPPPPRRLAPPRPPPLVEVGALWAQCLPVWENPELARALLEFRGLDPAVIGDRDLARTLPPDGSLPGWARFNGRTWRDSGHLLIVPLCDALGEIQSLHARSLRPGADPKGLSPAGHASAGLILACPLARQVLGGGIPAWWRHPAPPAFIVAEGVPDFLTVACRYGEMEYAPATVGVLSGAWSGEVAARIPDRCRVVIRTHADEAGRKYQAEIAASLCRRCRVEVPRHE